MKKVTEYLKKAFRLTSMIFTILVVINLTVDKHVLFNIIEFVLFISIISGGFLFLVEDNETYSNRQMLINQTVYIGVIFFLIVIGNQFFEWELGVLGLVKNLLVVFLLFFFIKFVMYSNDKKEAQEINRYLQKEKNRV